MYKLTIAPIARSYVTFPCMYKYYLPSTESTDKLEPTSEQYLQSSSSSPP
jgi:hypothetical protein